MSVDQASVLRELMGGGRRAGRYGGPRVVAVTSGKGGVGKTSLAVNLGIELSRKGQRVLIFDADFGLSNVDVLLGAAPGLNLSHVLSGDHSLGDVIAEGPCGLRYIAGGSGVLSLLRMDHDQIRLILAQLKELENETDVILLDTGAGVSDNVLRLVTTASDALVVITPEPTSVMDAYALVKAVLSAEVTPRLFVLVNRAASPAEAESTLQKFCAVVRLYLDANILSAGYVLADEAVVRAVRTQRPFVLMSPRSAAARNIDSIAWGLMRDSATVQTGAVQSFFSRLLRRG